MLLFALVLREDIYFFFFDALSSDVYIYILKSALAYIYIFSLQVLTAGLFIRDTFTCARAVRLRTRG